MAYEIIPNTNWLDWVHPGRLTWNLQITHLEKKMIFQWSEPNLHEDMFQPLIYRGVVFHPLNITQPAGGELMLSWFIGWRFNMGSIERRTTKTSYFPINPGCLGLSTSIFCKNLANKKLLKYLLQKNDLITWLRFRVSHFTCCRNRKVGIDPSTVSANCMVNCGTKWSPFIHGICYKLAATIDNVSQNRNSLPRQTLCPSEGHSQRTASWLNRHPFCRS